MDPMNDAALEREIERALAVDPSPEFVARVRTRIAEEPSPASRGFGWLFAAAATAAIAATALLMVRMVIPTRQPASAQLLASRSIGSAMVVPAVGPAKAGPHEAGAGPHETDAGGRSKKGERSKKYVGSGFSRTYASRTPVPAPLFDPRETMALQRLIADVHDARVDLSPLLKEPMAAPMTPRPIDDLVIPPLLIEPLSGTEGERP